MKYNMRTFPLVAMAVLLVLANCLLPGCKPAGESKAASPAKPRVALIMKSLANEFFMTMESGAKEHQRAHADEYDWLANGIKNETDLADAVLASSGVKFPFVGPGNRKGAKIAGNFLAKKLKAGDKVVIVEGAPNAFNGIQRKLGFEDAMKAAG
jgi:ribose transport system substrate-binding protein